MLAVHQCMMCSLCSEPCINCRTPYARTYHDGGGCGEDGGVPDEPGPGAAGAGAGGGRRGGGEAGDDAGCGGADGQCVH